MLNYLKSYLAAAVVIATATLLVTACTKEGEDPNPPIEDPTIPQIPTDKFGVSIVWLGAENEHYADILSRANGASTELTPDAKLIFTSVDAFKANKEALVEPFQNGAVIVIFDPIFEQLRDIFTGNGFGIPLSMELDRTVLVAVSKYGCCKMGKIPENAEVAVPLDEDGNPIDISGLTPPAESKIDANAIGWRMPLFIKWVKEILAKSEITKSVSGIESKGMSDPYMLTHLMAWNVNVLLNVNDDKIGEEFWLQGVYNAAAAYKIEPMYAYEDQNANGDFYVVCAEYQSDPDDVYNGDYVWHPDHGGDECIYCGLYMRELEVSTGVLCNNGTIAFESGNSPIPATKNNVENHSETNSSSIGAGLSVGANVSGGKNFKDKSKTKGGGKLGASFSYGKQESHTVSYQVAELDIINNSTITSAGWTFQVNKDKFPGPDGDEGITGNTPGLAKGAAFLYTNWTWYYKGTKDYDTQSIGVFKTTIKPKLGATVNGDDVHGCLPKWQLSEQSAVDSLIIPYRIPFGTVEISNNLALSSASIGNIIFTQLDEDDNPVMELDEDGNQIPVEYAFYEGQDIAHGDKASINIPIGTYKVRLTRTSYGTETVLYHNKPTIVYRMKDPTTPVRLNAASFGTSEE